MLKKYTDTNSNGKTYNYISALYIVHFSNLMKYIIFMQHKKSSIQKYNNPIYPKYFYRSHIGHKSKFISSLK